MSTICKMNQVTSSSSFWCIKLSPGNICKIDLPESTELKLTNACIVPQTPPLPSNGISFMSDLPPPPSLTRLYAKSNNSYSQNDDLILLGTFIPGRIEHQVLQYTIQSENQTYTSLHNVSTGGAGEIIHVCGKISTINKKVEYEEDEEDEDKSNQDKNANDPSNNKFKSHFSYGSDEDDDELNFGGQNPFGAFGL